MPRHLDKEKEKDKEGKESRGDDDGGMPSDRGIQKILLPLDTSDRVVEAECASLVRHNPFLCAS